MDDRQMQECTELLIVTFSFYSSRSDSELTSFADLDWQKDKTRPGL